MASDTWFTRIESTIFTVLKTRLTNSLSDDYPNLFCTMSSQLDTDPVFPTVYIHSIGGMELGMDVENSSVNAVMEDLQIEVTTDTSLRDCTLVMAEVISQVKALHFNIVSLPIYTEGSVKRGIIRVNRVIGSDDSII